MSANVAAGPVVVGRAKPRAISLFSGIGGMDLAFAWCGFDVVAQVEIDPFCRAVLKKHAPKYWPNAVLFEDVHHVGKHNLPATDIIFGGFPCQSVSVAGKREGIKEGTQSGLWIEFARIIGELRPKVVLLENVPGILSQDGIRVLADLASIGYDAEWRLISAASVGAPHKRERWFCVAYSASQCHQRQCGITADYQQQNTTGYGKFFNKFGDGGQSLADANGTWQPQSEGSFKGFRGWAEYDSQDVVNASGTRRQECDTPAQPSCAGHATGRRDQGELGNSTVERLQGSMQPAVNPPVTIESQPGQTQPLLGSAVNGLPGQLARYRWPARPGEPQYEWEAPRITDDNIPYRNARLKALGNAVVPQVVEPIARAIKEYLETQQ